MGAERTGCPAMFAIGCAEDIEVMPEQKGTKKEKKRRIIVKTPRVFIRNAAIAEWEFRRRPCCVGGLYLPSYLRS